MESEDSLPCSKEPIISPYPDQDESNPHPLTLFPLDPFEYYFLKFPNDLYPSGFTTKIF
jgi:hypothetical protein